MTDNETGAFLQSIAVARLSARAHKVLAWSVITYGLREAWPIGVQRASELLGCSRSTARRTLGELGREAWIEGRPGSFRVASLRLREVEVQRQERDEYRPKYGRARRQSDTAYVSRFSA